MIYSDAVVWATLRHPHVLRLLGVTDVKLPTPSTLPRIVMPWVENRNIEVQIRFFEETLRAKPPLSLWISQIASGLEYLHQEGIVHGSMRTSNVMVDNYNIVVLADYDMEKYIARTDEDSEPPFLNAAADYTWYAPEQYLANHFTMKKPTQEGDIYSFGCVWLHLHSRHRPFHDVPFNVSVYEKWKQGTRVGWPRDGLMPHCTIQELQSLEVWRLVSRCLSENPDDRPKARDLQEIAKHDALWIRDVYYEPSMSAYSKRDQPSRVPFEPPSRYRWTMYRLRTQRKIRS
ncbi:kinase-like protein [Panus rudis PR-1116 ss-1]|nr:kinase-like protein [Panus rudis PR-1116 ss-1]